MASILEIEGIGRVNAAKLRNTGVRSTTALLNRAGSAKGRKELASATGIDESVILVADWIKVAKSLSRIVKY